MSGSMIKRGAATVLAAAGALVLSMTAAGGAQAAPAAEKCTIKTYSPGKFVVNATDTERQFRVYTSGCTQKNWSVKLIDTDGSTVLLATKAKPLTKFFPKELVNELAGGYTVVVTVKSTDDETTKKKFGFYLQRRSTFGTSFNAGPEPRERGQSLRVVGTLKRVSWGPHPSYKTYSNRTVRVQFKAAGATKYVNVKTAKTNAAGKVSTLVTVSKSGTWRLFYGGNAATGATVSSGDAVTVS